ncbi:hypothetical protein HZB90_00900 [archaeon]|nr:hypothetical protein [archaeon]
MPLCASSILFFMTKRRYSKVRRNKQLLHIAKSFVLCASLLAIWYAVMLLAGWYDPGFHILATAFSAVMVTTGKSWGVIEKLVN